MRFPLFPRQASSIAPDVDAIYWGLTAFCVGILLLVFVPMLYFLFKYRRTRHADRSPPRINTLAIELTWTIIPILLAIGMFAWGAMVYFNLTQPPAEAQDIYVVARQWMWKFQHPSGRREINELHVPVNQVIKLTLASEDVIHSFFVPAFRVKQDVVPGRYVTTWFQPTRVGVYHLFCAEYCGTDHSRMRGRIHVMGRADYEQWLNHGEPPAALSAVGARLYVSVGCSGCHSGASIVRAPRLEGLFGRPVPLQNGQFVTADESYLRDSILLPQSQVAAGYEPLMPTYQGQLTEEQVLQLVAYLKSLGSRTPESFP